MNNIDNSISSAGSEIKSLTARVHGVIGLLKVPFKLPHPQACSRSLVCPVKPHAPVVYKEGLLVSAKYPKVSKMSQGEIIDR